MREALKNLNEDLLSMEQQATVRSAKKAIIKHFPECDIQDAEDMAYDFIENFQIKGIRFLGCHQLVEIKDQRVSVSDWLYNPFVSAYILTGKVKHSLSDALYRGIISEPVYIETKTGYFDKLCTVYKAKRAVATKSKGVRLSDLYLDVGGIPLVSILN
jgi:hypothetical protein